MAPRGFDETQKQFSFEGRHSQDIAGKSITDRDTADRNAADRNIAGKDAAGKGITCKKTGRGHPAGPKGRTPGGGRIGLDESGKGDYFGPLVVGAVYADEDIDPKLKELGVRDSKRLTDKRMLTLASEIKALCPYSVVVISPTRYNQLYERFRNLNRLLAWAHARALENVLEKVQCNLAIADQFGDESFLINALLKRGRQVRLEQHPRAEADLAVAAASILARAEFVRRIEKLSEQVGRPLPKGASNPDIIIVGSQIIRDGGRAALGDVAKLHFRTTGAIIPDD